MNLYIKNMVCPRCKMAVGETLEKLNLHPLQIDLGEVKIEGEDISHVIEDLKKCLAELGFELLEEREEQILDKIKSRIIDLIHEKDNELDTPLSEYLSRELLLNYHSLSSLFSERTGMTIERYYILQKIERVKELLAYDDLNLTEIAYRLHYTDVAHLSRQFKKVTGITPSEFKKGKAVSRRSLDMLS